MKSKPGIIVIGGSAGSLDIVLKIVPTLPPSLNVAVVIILHRKLSNDTVLVDLLSTRTPWLVKEADEKEPLLPNVIYVAPADYHLLIEHDHTFSLDASEKINYSRPSIDVTFESASEVYQDATLGMLLSGANADGTTGLQIIKEANGKVVIQDPHTAGVPYMPQQALNNVEPDLIVNENNLDQLAVFLCKFSESLSVAR